MENHPEGSCSGAPGFADDLYMNSTSAHRTTRCSECRSGDVLTVGMNMTDASVLFWTCAACETTGWVREGSLVSREAALTSIPRR